VPVITNFQSIPAPLSMFSFVGTGALEIALWTIATALVAMRRRRPVSLAAAGGMAVAIAYFAALVGLSIRSRERILERGTEKYFCEIDCHVAYSVVGVETRTSLGGRSARGSYRIVTLRIRFDERTTAPGRPREAPLTQELRFVRLVDGCGRNYPRDAAGEAALARMTGPQTPLTASLRPGESYETRIVFDIPVDVRDPRLVVTGVAWMTPFLLGYEGSLLHARTTFRL
jgi:hypothetical protein